MTTSVAGIILYGIAFALVGAFITTPEHSDLAQRFQAGAGSAAIAFVGLYVLIFVVKYLTYRARPIAGWEPVGRMTGNAVIFSLARKVGGHPVTAADFGVIECSMRAPDGQVVLCSSERQPANDGIVTAAHNDRPTAMWENTTLGEWSVRWYVTGNKDRTPHELVRGTFQFSSHDAKETRRLR